ncbi:hypothetical protein D918_05108 [Trichuris suis]|nr:hypothetical protein D918_05108 [Trichuris suis]
MVVHLLNLVTLFALYCTTGVAQYQGNWGQGYPAAVTYGQNVQVPGESNYQGTTNGRAPRAYIAMEAFPMDRNMHHQKLSWREPFSFPVYCISEAPANQLVFSCLDCNSTEINQAIMEATEDRSGAAGFPAVRLNSLRIDNNWHNKRLGCTVFYEGSQGTENVTVMSLLDVQYLTQPIVLNDKFSPGVGNSSFYSTFPATLHCKALGNPPPTQYVWYVKGQRSSDGPMTSIPNTLRREGIQCEASSSVMPAKMSKVVTVDELRVPQLTGHNFRDVKASSVFEPNSNRLNLDHRDHRLSLLCQARGYPLPRIFWFHRLANSNEALNASCEEAGRSTVHQPPGKDEVVSSCSLLFDSYFKSGFYWCRACAARSANDWVCNANFSPNDGIQVDVTGPPVVYDEPLLQQIPNTNEVRIRMSFCSDPPPDVPNGMYWIIDGQRLNAGERMDNFVTDQLSQNISYPACYSSVLTINPLNDADRRKNVEFYVKNQVGQTTKAVNLAALIDDKRTKQQKAAPKQQKKKYPINIIPEVVRGVPQKERSPVAVASPPTDFYKPPESLYPTAFDGQQTREGLNYAELDLVKDAAVRWPVTTSTSLPVEYSRLQPYKAPTSSIV